VIPLRDGIPTATVPFVTLFLIGANIIVFVYQVSLGPAAADFVGDLGIIPYEIVNNVELSRGLAVPGAVTFVTAMFLHGGIMHLAGNMMFLWIFGNNVEDATGHLSYLVFYVACGVAASWSHVLLNPASKLPMIGASGAVSGILGAYLLLYPRARVLTLIPIGFFFQTVLIPAGFFLGLWFLLQFFSGWMSLGGGGGGVAWFAHVGGFAAGIPLLLLFKKKRVKLFSRQTGWRR
jgi:membrane associated rhomboid family serine protease